MLEYIKDTISGMVMVARLQQSKTPPLMNSQVLRRFREVGAIVLMACHFFLLIALITYHENDPGWSKTAHHLHIYNSAGPLGAWCADVLFTLFGYLAYLWALACALMSYHLFTWQVMPRPSLLALSSLGFSLALSAGAGLSSLHFKDLLGVFPDGAGGILGKVIVTHLRPQCHDLGSTLILLTTFAVGVTLAVQISWLEIIDSIGISVLEFLLALMGFVHRQSRRSLQQSMKFYQKYLKAPNNAPIVFIPQQTKPKNSQSSRDPLELPHHAIDAKNTKSKTGPRQVKTHLPALELLTKGELLKPKDNRSEIELEALSAQLENRLNEFGVAVKVVTVLPGPVVTRFELELQAGQKVNKITALAKDLARALLVTRVRIVEIIPGKPYVGLEIPNQTREIVRLRDLLESAAYQESAFTLPLALGKDISGGPVVTNLAQMPHLLVAGTTGSGKSVGINTMLLSLLYKAKPRDLKLILIDPKMLELAVYDGIPHLLTPVVTDMKDAGQALKWCVAEMERRYQLLAKVGVRSLASYNEKILEANFQAENSDALADDTEQASLKVLPHIVIIIDEFADMIMVVGKKVEELIARIAQKARAAGIHMILATQRPSVDVITGLIKANIPTRIAFQVSSRIDSRTILDQQGAEQLLGQGDMLYLAPGTGIPTRIHGAFVTDDEVHNIVAQLKACGEPDYLAELLDCGLENEEEGEQSLDALFDEAVKIVTDSQKASISNLQRRLKIGYNRAARLIESLEHSGIVSPANHNGNREVLAPQHIT